MSQDNIANLPLTKTTTSEGKTPATEKKFSEIINSSWSVVEKSRHPQRPHTLDYINSLFMDYEELKGDRAFSDDASIVAGVGVMKNHEGNSPRKVFFMGQQKGRNTKQKIERNFGMAKPEGYRKACRVMELAERFGKPILTLIDTPGAYPGIGAEERGQSAAIAESIEAIFKVKVPTLGVVIGEGGSGGALAIGVTDRLLMLQNSTYSVISPESCAAILWGSASEAKRAAWALKMGAEDTLRLGICDEVIAEPGEGAHESFDAVCAKLMSRIDFHFGEISKLSAEQRMEKRFAKYRFIDRA